MSFFFWKKRFKCHICTSETNMQTPRENILNQATLPLVFSLTSLISASLHTKESTIYQLLIQLFF